MDFNLSNIGYKSTEKLIQSAEKGIEVYTGDNIRELEFNVLQDNKARRGKLVEVQDCNFYPFCVMAVDGSKQYFAYVYPIPIDNTKIISSPDTQEDKGLCEQAEPIFLPYPNMSECINHAKSLAPESDATHPPLVWIRHKENGNTFIVTGFLNTGVFADTFYNFEELLEKFEYFNHEPCGVTL